MRTVKECQDILEMAIGEIDHVIPTDVLENTVEYLEELQKLRSEKSWRDSPEAMGWY